MTLSEIEALRDTQQTHMMDKCLIYPFLSWDKDDRGSSQGKIFSDPVESICGLKMSLSENRKNYQGDNYETIEADAMLRLPGDVSVKPKDEVLIIERFGSAVSDGMRYEVVKYPNIGVSGLQVLLKAVYA